MYTCIYTLIANQFKSSTILLIHVTDFFIMKIVILQGLAEHVHASLLLIIINILMQNTTCTAATITLYIMCM